MHKAAACIATILVGPFAWGFRVLERAGVLHLPGISQLLALLPGRPGQVLRPIFYSMVLDGVSRHCRIEFGTIFANKDIRIGNNVYIGAYCIIGGCSIGGNTLVGSFVDIMAGPHTHGIRQTAVPIREQPGKYEPVTIGSDCWIGNKAVVMRSVGDGSIVGAGSIVNRPVPPGSVVAGNPARVIGTRARQDCGNGITG
jgi:acetyltransferase-like isoleucine patch superfamily enzyme